MSRSIKKGPFVDSHLAKKVDVAAANRDRKPKQLGRDVQQSYQILLV